MARKAFAIFIPEVTRVWVTPTGHKFTLIPTGQTNTHGHRTYRAFHLPYYILGRSEFSVVEIKDLGCVITDGEIAQELIDNTISATEKKQQKRIKEDQEYDERIKEGMSLPDDPEKDEE